MKSNVIISRITSNVIGSVSGKRDGNTPSPEPDITDALVMEDGSLFLMEDGSYFKLEGNQTYSLEDIISYFNL